MNYNMFECEIAIAKGQNVCLKDNLIDFIIDPTELESSSYTYCTDYMFRSDIDIDNKKTSIEDQETFKSEKRRYMNMLRWTCPK